MTLAATTVDTLRGLQELIGRANDAKGFHEEGKQIGVLAKMLDTDEAPGIFRPFVQLAFWLFPALRRNYWTARIALITTEVAEGIEELRNGRAVDETWYSAEHEGVKYAWVQGERPESLPDHVIGKPEGVPSELADVVVRAFDFAHEADIDLAGMIAEKLAYNASRARMHGRKF